MAVTAGLLSAPASAREHKTGIWKVLRDGGFSGAMNEDAHVQPIGRIDVTGRHYQLMDFDWEESPKNMQGSWPHGQTRLLVFEERKKGMTYLGSYVYHWDFADGNAPRIEGRAVVFPYKEDEIMGVKINKRIVFGKEGPPAQVVLDGDICEFFK